MEESHKPGQEERNVAEPEPPEPTEPGPTEPEAADAEPRPPEPAISEPGAVEAGIPEEAASLPDVDARMLVMTCVQLLGAKAWERMGLVASPSTQKIERRLDDAQLAIDAAAALVNVMRERVDEAERRELDTLLMNLRLNYVEQQKKG